MKTLFTSTTKMLRSVLYTGIALMLFCTASAQKGQGMSAEQRAQKLTDWMKTNLKLNDDQVSKVHDINIKYANKMDELKGSSDDKKTKGKTLKANDAARDNELKAVLTDEQFKNYQSKKAQLKKSMKEKSKQKKQQST